MPTLGSGAGAPARLVLATTRASRAVLDGAWWPRSPDAPAELAAVLLALSKRYGRMRHVILGPSGWDGRPRRLNVGTDVVRVGWFASMNGALLIAITDRGDQFDLLIVPPSSTEPVAAQAMKRAADPGNREHAQDLLATSAGPI